MTDAEYQINMLKGRLALLEEWRERDRQDIERLVACVLALSAPVDPGKVAAMAATGQTSGQIVCRK